MRTRIIALLATVHFSFTAAVFCQEPQPSPPLSSALTFFDALRSTDVHSALRRLRSVPISPPERELVRATLPAEGALTPTSNEIKKLDALKLVLIYHGRDQVFDIKVIDLRQAYIGLHQRAILLVSRPALKVLSAQELQALVAHEVGHDFLWNEFERDRHGLARQELELESDGIGALTLVALGLDPMRLLSATRKLDHFNEQFGTATNIDDYPTWHDRARFVSTLLCARRSLHESAINILPSAFNIQPFCRLTAPAIATRPRAPPRHQPSSVPAVFPK